MNEIIDIPFRTMYIWSHLDSVLTFLAVALFVATIACIIFFVSLTFDAYDSVHGREDDKLKNWRLTVRWYWMASAVITGILFLICTLGSALAPSEKEFHMYVAAKIVDDVSKTEIATASKEVILKWLDKKLEELDRPSESQ